jgi:hypothetical protein
MTYTRQEPSQRYQELVGLYKNYHEAKTDKYLGHSLRPHISTIKTLVSATGARSILDYGSGKGLLYKQDNPSIRSLWNVDEIVCYDPGVAEFSTLPDGIFDGVISTDVLEHVPESDAPWIVREMFAHARRFVYANIANYPALKTLANGENAHCTQRPIAWWKAVFDKAQTSGVSYRIEVQSRLRIPIFGKVIKREATATG